MSQSAMHTTTVLPLRAVIAGLVFAVTAIPQASADVIRLKSGGEIRGKLLKDAKSTSGKPASAERSLTVETLTGGQVSVTAAEIAFVTRRPVAIEEYEVRLRRVGDTLEEHWALAEWCREKRLTEQRAVHLDRVVDLEPDHEQAHLALGHVWKDGAWVDWDEYMTNRGYVKHRGKWVTQPELELLQKTAAELQREQDWYPKIKLWSGWVTGTHSDRAAEGLAALKALSDPDVAPAVMRFLAGHPHPEIRSLGVSVLSQCGGPKSAVALIKVSLNDSEPAVRQSALDGIARDQASQAQGLLIQGLRHENNAIVRRAAVGLERFGDESAIAPLIEALVTTHRYYIRAPGSSAPSYSFSSDGSLATQSGSLPPGLAAAMRTGQLPQGVIVLNSADPVQNLQQKTVMIKHEHQNAEVLAALQRLTGEDFGYDERSWRLWWAAQKHESGGLSKS